MNKSKRPNYQKIRVFVASPNDIRKERKCVKIAIDRINDERSDDFHIILEYKDWNDVMPAMGLPENVILEQLPIETSDIFVGIIWHRFGSPTGCKDPQTNKQYESGTEQEFSLAYRSWLKNKKPYVLFYQCHRKCDPYEIDPAQLENVKSFFSDFSPNRNHPGLVKAYNVKLEDIVRADLTKCIQQIVDTPDIPSNISIKDKEFIYIPNDRFIIGTSQAHAMKLKSIYKDDYDPFIECPEHELHINSFYISRYLVTNSDYQKFINETGHKVPYRDDSFSEPYNWDRKKRTFPENKGNHPVVLVSWYDGQAYCKWFGCRLPTEAEWEKAARGIDALEWPWGNSWQNDCCNTSELNIQTTTPVDYFSLKGKGASSYGVCDMAGNVWELCNSIYEEYPYKDSGLTKAINFNEKLVLRGGCFASNKYWVRSALRHFIEPDDNGITIGFRIVLPYPL